MFGSLAFVPYLGFAAIAVGVIGLALSRRRRSQKPKREAGEVISDWRPTGKIDFSQTGADDAALFFLQTEEYRVLQSLSGTKHVEVRWRPATLEDAKRITSWNNSRTGILDLPLPESVRTEMLVPSLSDHEAIAGGDEHAHITGRPH
jgi:hypothetical protein